MSKATEIEVIILDKDGVFVNFENLWGKIIVYRSQLLAENSLNAWEGFETVRNDCMRVMGLNPETEEFDPYSPGSSMPFEHVKIALASCLFTSVRKFRPEFNWKNAIDAVEQSVVQVKSSYNYVDLSEPIDGSIEKINEIHNAGFKLAVLTSDIKENAIGALEKFGVKDKFTRVNAGKRKTPEVYQKICDELGVPASKTVMVGDTPYELESARSCGATTVGVLSGVVPEHEKQILEEHADMVLGSLADLDLSNFMTAISGNNILSNSMAKLVTIFSDGASRGNPGDASIGVVLEEEGREVSTISKTLGIATNNEAEYQALIAGLEEAANLGYEEVAAFADSELMIKQLNGEYKVKSENVKPLFKQAKELEKKFKSINYTHIKREKNKKADKLANLALDT